MLNVPGATADIASSSTSAILQVGNSQVAQNAKTIVGQVAAGLGH
jgi:hypothetical protein